MQEQKKKEFIRVVKYALFAASAGIIQFGSFTLMTEFSPLPYWPRYLISLVLSVVWNFTFNRKFTFKSANNIPIAMLKVAAYYAVFTPASTILGHYLVERAGWNDYVVEVMNMLINFVTEFLYQRFFVFGKSINTNAAARAEAESAGKGEGTLAAADDPEEGEKEEKNESSVD